MSETRRLLMVAADVADREIEAAKKSAEPSNYLTLDLELYTDEPSASNDPPTPDAMKSAVAKKCIIFNLRAGTYQYGRPGWRPIGGWKK